MRKEESLGQLYKVLLLIMCPLLKNMFPVSFKNKAEILGFQGTFMNRQTFVIVRNMQDKVVKFFSILQCFEINM